MIKYILRKLLPPFILDLYHYIKQSDKKEAEIREINRAEFLKSNLYWKGNYQSWQDAMKYAEGYDTPQILEKVKNSILKVKKGEVAYERDGVLFYDHEYQLQLLSCLLKISIAKNLELDLVDFGGSLGSTYFQNIHFLRNLKSVNWSVVEQAHFVQCGNEAIKDEHLQFFEDIDKVFAERNPSTLLLSGVLQCLENPFDWIKKFLNYPFEYIIIDRTNFINDENHLLTVQYVPENIYKASYPSWFFSEDKLIDFFKQQHYTIIATYDPYPGIKLDVETDKSIYFKSFFLQKLNNLG